VSDSQTRSGTSLQGAEAVAFLELAVVVKPLAVIRVVDNHSVGRVRPVTRDHLIEKPVRVGDGAIVVLNDHRVHVRDPSVCVGITNARRTRSEAKACWNPLAVVGVASQSMNDDQLSWRSIANRFVEQR